MKCGSPIVVYPPDDIHKVASRERSSFLEAVEGVGICGKCNETTHLYWGKLVFYRFIIILARQAAAAVKPLIGRLPLRSIGAKASGEATGPDSSISDEERTEIENRVVDYISENGGAIIPSRAADELGIPVDLLRELLESMKSDGRLSQAEETPASP
jgi:hypothetical protein